MSIIEKLGGFEACAALYAQFMADALSLPRGMRFAREPDEDPSRESAMHKLEMHASREALSLSITPLCSRVRAECHRFNKDPVRLPLLRGHRTLGSLGLVGVGGSVYDVLRAACQVPGCLVQEAGETSSVQIRLRCRVLMPRAGGHRD